VVDVEEGRRGLGAMPDAANEWRTELAITPNRRARLEIPASVVGSTPAGGNPVCAAAAGSYHSPSMVSLRFGATEQKRVLNDSQRRLSLSFCGKSHQSALRCRRKLSSISRTRVKDHHPQKHLCRRRVLQSTPCAGSKNWLA